VQHPIIKNIQKECQSIIQKYTHKNPVLKPFGISYQSLKEQTDAVFIALHGRPGEDGEVQAKLEALNIPYNGSSSNSAQVTINKYQTLQRLKKGGMQVTDQLLVAKSDFLKNRQACIRLVEKDIEYPLIAKPVDDGCSSAVKKIKDRATLIAYLSTLFRNDVAITDQRRVELELKKKEEFPCKELALIEALIDQKNAVHFLEITGGLLTKHKANGKIEYEIFEPSEALSSGEVLSLEEKFLAGEGQNITPARYIVAGIKADYSTVASQVKESLKKAAILLNVTSYARIDAFVRVFEDGRAETIIIEVNSLPGMTPATCIFHQCALNNYKPYDFIDHILEFGKQRNELLLQSTNQ
jgi:D-alanine-D-alanine ligase